MQSDVQHGFSAVQALTAGASTAADALGHAELGRLTPGSVADFVVVEGDVTEDIGRLRDVQEV